MEKMHISNAGNSFIIASKLKTTMRVLKPKIVKCVNSSNPALLTSKFGNENHDYLFLSWATIKSVTKVPLARWLKTILVLSGVDTKVFFCLLL